MILPFGYKAARFIKKPPEQDKKINILTGSIRSSKTWCVNAKLLKMLSKGFWPGGAGLITGNTRSTVKTNIIDSLVDWAGPGRSHYSVGNGELKLFGRSFKVMGAGDEQAYKALKGATVGIWIADEATLYPESFWDMAVSRLSLPQSRCYATTNPASPYHYLKKKWLDNPLQNKVVWQETYTLDDNPNIDDETRANYYTMYTGVFYQRNILGLWVIAEGAIYKDVIGPGSFYNDLTRPLTLLSQHGHTERFIAIDVGTINAMCMLDIYDDGKVLWVENEYYYDSKLTNKQKTNGEYASDFMVFVNSKSYRDMPSAVVDPSAASFKVELANRGIVVQNAENDVLEGIRKVSSLLARRAIRIHERCTNLKRELETYAWDEKRAANTGLEVPVKQNDHACFTADTQIQTPDGEVPIQLLKVGDYVSTPLGRARVLDNITHEAFTVEWNNTQVTPEHPVATSKGWIRVDALRYDDSICKLSNPLYSKELFLEDTQNQKDIQIETTSNREEGILKKVWKVFTERCGRQYLDPSQMDTMYIIKMKTRVIMKSIILNFYPSSITYPCMERIENQTWNIWLPFDLLLKNGTLLKKGQSGISNMEKSRLETYNHKIIPVGNVKSCFNPRRLLKKALSFVLTNVSRLSVVNRALMMNPEFARAVARGLSVTSTVSKQHVAGSVVTLNKVYALKTEHGCYYANGVLVSNCDALRYGIFTKIPDYRIAA